MTAGNRRAAAWPNAVVLGGVMGVLLALVGTAHYLSQERIAAQRQLAEQRMLQALLPAAYDNDPLSDRREWRTDAFFARPQHFTVYRARRQGTPAGVVLAPIEATGYNGPIELAIGIDARGRITGVRVLSHRETRDLGSGIDQSESDWIRQFRDTSLDNPTAGDWKLTREGGAFDGLSGATVSPRAVIMAVRHALEFYQARHERLYE